MTDFTPPDEGNDAPRPAGEAGRSEAEPGGPRDEEEDFAAMLEESLEPRTVAKGDLVEGTVVSVGRDTVFVDIGGKGEAAIDLDELVDDDGDLEVQPGDVVQAVVVSTVGGLKLSHKLARGAASRQRLEEAFNAGIPVEGKVERSIKGGFEVRVAGLRAFCPISQIDNRFTEDPSIHEGQLYTFLILEYKNEGKDLVVSRRRLLEDEEREKAEELRQTIVPGAILEGRVASVRDYGAFVDLGAGIQGLLHVSEMGWSRVSNPASIVQPGDAISVKVLKVDDAQGKISLGLKQLQADPWDQVPERFSVGQTLEATVTRLAEFGAFVELEAGVEALAHVSTFPPGGKRDAWKKLVSPGKRVPVQIASIDAAKKRIGVSVLDEGSVRAEQARRADEATGPQQPAQPAEGERLGSLADQLRAAMKPKKD